MLRAAALVGALIALAVPAGATGAPACTLALRAGTASQRPPGQLHLHLVVVATGGSCRVSGFPRVELVGPDDATFGPIYELPRQLARPQSLRLGRGQRAHAVLTWLRDGRWTPDYALVIVETDSGPSPPLTLPGRGGPVLRQDAATHPGSYVGPLRPGA
jgi:hypothetical protein